MKVVVFSDPHGDKKVVERILNWNKDSKHFLSLGDTELPQDYLMDNNVTLVMGNHIGDAGFVYERVVEIEGLRIFMTHGHKYNVHRTLDLLVDTARSNKYDLVLFGHTHILEIEHVGKVQFLNPGSCARPRNTLPPTYAVLDITDKKLTITIKDAIDNRTIEV